MLKKLKQLFKKNIDDEIPNLDDLEKLEQLYQSAKSECAKITWHGPNPQYPDSIYNLMRYITGSKWCDHGYTLDAAREISTHLDSASIPEIKSLLTALSRSEHFCTGAWKHILMDDRIFKIIKRAKEIIKA